jgi:hypothetical protein
MRALALAELRAQAVASVPVAARPEGVAEEAADQRVAGAEAVRRGVLYVRNELELSSMQALQTGSDPDFLLGYFGVGFVQVSAPFRGTLIAPDAHVILHSVGTDAHRGVFFAERVSLQSDARLVYVPMVP